MTSSSTRSATRLQCLSPTSHAKNEEAVLQAVSGHALPVHCFGIDHAVNEAFLRQLARQQRETSVLLIAILGSRLRRPALTDLALGGGWELADTGVPDIHSGQVIFASMRAASKLSKINVAGRDAAGQPLTLAPETHPAETDLPKLIWMKHRIDSLLQAIFATTSGVRLVGRPSPTLPGLLMLCAGSLSMAHFRFFV